LLFCNKVEHDCSTLSALHGNNSSLMNADWNRVIGVRKSEKQKALLLVFATTLALKHNG